MRPYVLLNAVASLDGKTTLEGKASGLGGAADRAVMRTLRSGTDAVMVGGGTLRAEKLSLGLDPGDFRPRPMAVVFTNTGDVPLEHNLVSDPNQRVLVLLSEDAQKSVERRLGRLAEVRRVPANQTAIDPGGALEVLKDQYGVEVLLCEGGPTLNHALVSRGLVDEIFLTVAPQVVGGAPGETPTLLDGPPIGEPCRPALELLSVHFAERELFLRYSLTRDASGPPRRP